MVISDSYLRRLIKDLVLESESVEKLRVLDFDDTIAETKEQVKLYTDGGKSFRMLDSDEFAVYKPKEDEYYDESSFYQFDDVDVDSAEPVGIVANILRNFVESKGSRRVLILTARNQAAESGIRSFLKSINIDDENIDVVGVGNKDPIAKVHVIHHYLTKVLSGVRFVSFFDDSGPNVKAVKDYLTQLNIPHDVARVVDEEGLKKLVRIVNKQG